MLLSSTIYDTPGKTDQNHLKHNISCSGTISLFIGPHVMCPLPIIEQEYGLKGNNEINGSFGYCVVLRLIWAVMPSRFPTRYNTNRAVQPQKMMLEA